MSEREGQREGGREEGRERERAAIMERSSLGRRSMLGCPWLSTEHSAVRVLLAWTKYHHSLPLLSI